MALSIKKPPTPQQFYIEYPLYEQFTFEDGQEEAGWLIKYFQGTIDTYCPDCSSHSIFSHKPNQISFDHDSWITNHKFAILLTCSRDKNHLLYFLFQVHDRTIQKIGQYPSLAALNLYDVRQYSSVLEKEKFQEFTKAIGLAAHGVGVGSFVYLRRIFEGLVEQAHHLAKVEANWNEEEFVKARMSEKILQLSQYLPKFLVENRSMYGILSKGIHELSEEECLDAFPVLKIGIEIILDAKLREAAEQKKLKQAAAAIQGIAMKMGSSK